MVMNKLEQSAESLYSEITTYLIDHRLTISTMESCTCGLIGCLLTDTEGSSAVFPGGVSTYSNQAKILFGVDPGVIETYGVYSASTAAAMAEVIQETFHTDLSIGITGSFENADPANPDSIPGHIDYAIRMFDETHLYSLDMERCSSRREYKYAAALAAGESLVKLLHTEDLRR